MFEAFASLVVIDQKRFHPSNLVAPLGGTPRRFAELLRFGNSL